MQNVKIGFLEICLVCGTYLYTKSFYLSIALVSVALLSSLFVFLIKKHEEKEAKKSIERLIKKVASGSSEDLTQIKTYGDYEN